MRASACMYIWIGSGRLEPWYAQPGASGSAWPGNCALLPLLCRELFDLAPFIALVRAHGLAITTDAPPTASVVSVPLDGQFDYMGALTGPNARYSHLR